MIPFAEIPDALLAPLAGRDPGVWLRAPAGAWSPGEIVAHVSQAIATSARAFASRRDRPPMRRRQIGLVARGARWAVLEHGLFPPGLRAPEVARPPLRPDRDATERQLREGVAEFLALVRDLLPARAHDLFVKHPLLGDLTLEEWMRFHERHAEHHRRQIVKRVARE